MPLDPDFDPIERLSEEHDLLPLDLTPHPDDDSIEIELIEEFDTTPPPTQPLHPELLSFLRKTRVLSADRLLDLPPVEWFIEDLLPEGQRTMVHGLGGSYKSFVVLDWVLCAATEERWHGHWVKPGKVLYMAGEGARGLGKRLRAWMDTHGASLADLDNIDFMADPFELKNPDHAEVWRSFVQRLNYDYIVIDTLHTATAGADENSATDMGLVLKNATRIAGDAKLIFVHHTVKSGSGHRGSGALRDDMDVVVSLAPVDGVDLTAQLTSDKIRDADPFRPVNISFAKHGDGLAASLYITGIQTDAKRAVKEKERTPSAVDRAADAITEHGLDFMRGEDRLTAQLKDLNLGYNFAPKTVGAAIRRLRGAGQEVKDMAAGRVEIELEPEDQ